MNGDDVLHWPGRVLAAADLRHGLNGHGAVSLAPAAVLTPLAADELRARGVRVERRDGETRTAGTRRGYAADRPYPPVMPAVLAVRREGHNVTELSCADKGSACRWSRAVGECEARGECGGGVLFCEDPGLVCCVANKVPGVRAVGVTTVGQAARAVLTAGANLLAVEMPGRTYFEVSQILRTLCAGTAACPDCLATTLRELDGHAHR